MKLAIMNSDQRMQEVYFHLSSMYEVVLINEFTNFERFTGADALILPVKGITTTGSLVANGKEFALPESFWKHFYHKPVFAGIPQAFLEHEPFQLHYYMLDDSFKENNARYTAEGVLFLLIDNTSRCIQDLGVDVIGYGVSGKEIVKWLESLHVKVRIIRREANSDDPRFICVETYKKMECGDVIINTSITPVLNHDVLTSYHHKPLIIDIATPDVIDYTTAISLGIRVIKAGNLPNMVAYESAGIAIANYVRGILHGER